MTRSVPKLLSQITQTENLSLTSAALRQLMRLPWAGNIEHLRRVLVQVAHQRRSGAVDVNDLPPECRTTSRRQLSQLESLERDAIVEALLDHRGSKESAAQHLGMSRATIYRKIRHHGIAVNLQGHNRVTRATLDRRASHWFPIQPPDMVRYGPVSNLLAHHA